MDTLEGISGLADGMNKVVGTKEKSGKFLPQLS